LLIYTVVEVAVPWFLLSNAERRLSSSLSGVLVSTVPLIGALVVWLVGGDERPGPRRVAGLIIGLGGVVALLGLNVTTGDLGAVGQILLVAVGYALGPLIIARRLVDLPAGGVVVTSLALSAFAYAPAFAFSIPHHLPAGTAVAAIAVLAVVCTAIAFLVFFRLIAEVGPIRSTVITYVNPAVAVVLGVAFLHERFTVGTGIGFVLILAGCYLATVRTAPRRTPVPALVPEP
jgi:drug/metabolite transporter (DMT)-like permease